MILKLVFIPSFLGGKCHLVKSIVAQLNFVLSIVCKLTSREQISRSKMILLNYLYS